MSDPQASLALTPADRERLRSGAAALGVGLDAEALRRFTAYGELLDRWQRTTNLISCASGDELVERHLLDALAGAPLCAAAAAIADLGSGAGLPGVPLAIVDPRRRVDLVEPRRRRASFLRDVRRTLALEAVSVREMRAEDVVDLAEFVPVDVAVCRAVWADERVAAVAAPWLRPGGLLLVYRSAGHVAGAATVGVLTRERTLDYRIGTGRRRRIDVYRKHAE